jgi:hypothetical protein
MMRIPSIGLIEIIILAVVIGLPLLVVGLVLTIVAKKRRDRSIQAADGPGPGATPSKSSSAGKWLLLLGLVLVLALPLVVVVGGVLFVIPVRRESTALQDPTPMVQVVAGSTPIGTPLPTFEPTSNSGAGSVESPPPEPASLSITPDDGWLLVTLPGLTGLAVLVGVVILAVVLTRWRGSDVGPENVGQANGGDWARRARLRYALLALATWLALSIFLVLDVFFAVSVYWQFVAIYAAFWVLIGALLLVGSPRREKLLILGLLVVVLFSVRFVDWNSRKPFLKDLYRVEEDMTVAQVEQIMGDYMVGTGWPARPLGLPGEDSAAVTEELAAPDRLVYRHTDEGWGDSDWGEIRFEEGRVVEIRFLPD